VVDAGPAGISAALALAAAGLDVVLAAPPFDPGRNQADRRTTLLLPHSVDFLANLGVWPLCAMHSAPMLGLRIADSRRGVVTAPEILFSANELGLESFGANVPNPALEAALSEVADRAPRLRRIGAVAAAETGAHSVKLRLVDGGEAEARLAVAADGRNSLVRAAAGIGVKPWHYPQAAIAASFRHSRAHQGISTELHGRAGPLTTVPLPGDASSRVWVEEPDEARRLATLPDAQFIAALEEPDAGTPSSESSRARRAPPSERSAAPPRAPIPTVDNAAPASPA
jgi:2-octaprenyl-6-methoxyphenol hydroxylase